MGTTSHSIEVNAGIRLVYNQWIQFEEFPRFMEGVEEIRRESETRLFWRTRIGGIEKTWEAEITSQVPDERIAWQSVDGTPNAGLVTFEELAQDRTKISVVIEYEPEGILEKTGDFLGIPSSRIDGDLIRFRDFIEQGREEPGLANPKQVQNKTESWNDVPDSTTEAGSIGGSPLETQTPRSGSDDDTLSSQHPAEQTGEQSLGERADVDDGLQFYRDAAVPTRPAREEIAVRAYELFLRRGSIPGHETEDWLQAEKELAEEYKSRE
jgi:hypothetical protein